MERALKLFVFFLILSIFTSGCKSQSKMIDNSTVKELDINKYLGTWYEIARFPHSFERDLVGVTATYTLNDDGSIKVINQGYKNTLDGELSRATGKAKIPDPDKPAHLRVSFFWIFYSDYLVMELDPDYQWAVVGSSSSKYLWFLSRTPEISESLLTDLKKRISARGYDLAKLQMVAQKVD